MKPKMKKEADNLVSGKHDTLKKSFFYIDKGPDGTQPPLLFTENETNTKKLYQLDTYTEYTKDAFHRYVVEDEKTAINLDCKGTKVAPYFVLDVQPGESKQVRFRLTDEASQIPDGQDAFGSQFTEIFERRIREADDFYDTLMKNFTPEQKLVARQSYAGLLWSKQFYHYVVKDWLDGDPPPMPKPPESRLCGRNSDWRHLFNRDIVSMPDKWEYPWVSAL